MNAGSWPFNFSFSLCFVEAYRHHAHEGLPMSSANCKQALSSDHTEHLKESIALGTLSSIKSERLFV